MKRKIFAALPAIIMMIIIFSFSAQPSAQSNVSSDYIANRVIDQMEWVEDVFGTNFSFDSIQFHTVTFIIRKLAHTMEYAVLSLCSAFFFKEILSSKKQIFLWSIFICAVYACSVEFHQYFVQGWSCQFTDVLIDTNGAFIGSVLYYIGGKIREKSGQSKRKHVS